MNDQRIQQALPAILVVLLSIVFAIYAGSVIGSGQTRNLILISSGAAFIAIGLLFRSAVWTLIPLFWSFSGSIPAVPLPFSIHDLAIIVTFAWMLIFFAVRIIRSKGRLDLLDGLLLLNLCHLLFCYIRNPVGTLAFKSDLIGGRPYLTTALSVAAYLCLRNVSLSPKLARRLPFIILTPVVLLSAVGLLTHFVPSANRIIAHFYTGFITDPSSIFDPTQSRFTFLTATGTTLTLYLIARYSSLSFLNPLNFGRIFFLLVAIACTLFSGFRNALIFCALCAIIIPTYRKNRHEIISLVVGGGSLIALLIVIQGNALTLPPQIQRSLSFLPGKWDQDVLGDATHSVEWRQYMWKAMFSDDKYIKSWAFGDGFGYSQRLFNSSLVAQDLKQGNASQEHFLITGQVHSGPLSTIRYVGFVGLGLYLTLIIAMAIRAHRLILKARNTPLSLLTIFIGIPIILHPLIYAAVFGGFDGDFPQTIYSLGLLKLLDNTLRLHTPAKKKPSAPASPAPGLPVAPPRLIDLRPPLLQR